ncbi:MAG: type V CRISPR-associated endonuclease Cas1 [Clostridia bacterium]|nr:type V CRISPR-associated endonuclease Cas1 [Clostridia bacterium]
MISAGDFSKKQVLFVFFSRGEKLSFSNDNLVVKTAEGKIKFQCTCYRIFAVFAIGSGSITSGLIQRAKKFGFSIILLTHSMKPYQVIGSRLEGNTLLRRAQYMYDSLDIAGHLIKNKIANQRLAISKIRTKSEKQTEAIALLKEYEDNISNADTLHTILGLEGSASRIYFPAIFNNTLWQRRAPRTKCDMINALLDIGYTILFSYIDALLGCYGFDTYCGVLHREFYMRKSLVCDIVEPFRPLIDSELRKAINLKRCKEDDFIVKQGQYLLKWEKNAEYTAWLAKPIIENREEIYLYIQSYYRAFMRHKDIQDYPVFYFGGQKP